MVRVNREVALADKPHKKEKHARLTKANLEQLKNNLHQSLQSVQPKYGQDALDFNELVCGFRERVHDMHEEKAWKEFLQDREQLRKHATSSRYSKSYYSSQSSRS